MQHFKYRGAALQITLKLAAGLKIEEPAAALDGQHHGRRYAMLPPPALPPLRDRALVAARGLTGIERPRRRLGQFPRQPKLPVTFRDCARRCHAASHLAQHTPKHRPSQADICERVLAQRRTVLRPTEHPLEQAQAQSSKDRQHRLGGQLPGCRRRLPFARVAALPPRECFLGSGAGNGFRGCGPKTIPQVKGGPFQKCIRAIKGEGPMPGSNFEYSARLTEMAFVGVMAQRTSQDIEWDAAAMRVTNHPDFDRFVREPARRAWNVGDEVWS